MEITAAECSRRAAAAEDNVRAAWSEEEKLAFSAIAEAWRSMAAIQRHHSVSTLIQQLAGSDMPE